MKLYTMAELRKKDEGSLYKFKKSQKEKYEKKKKQYHRAKKDSKTKENLGKDLKTLRENIARAEVICVKRDDDWWKKANKTLPRRKQWGRTPYTRR